jgi:tetratricopeptide (TPR) repeat protein
MPSGTGPQSPWRAWRERALLTQEEVAERAGVSVRTVRRLEGRSGVRPQGATLRRLGKVLGLNEAEWSSVPDGGGDEPVGSMAVVPRELPAPPPSFVGRDTELAEIEKARDGSAVVVVGIVGLAGVGKTSLAVRAAHLLAEHHPDGQLFVDLHGHSARLPPLASGDVLERVLRTLGVPGERVPKGLDARAALYRTVLADRRMLVVLDNAVDEEQVEPLLPGCPGSLVLVTSRRRLSGLDLTRTVTLDVLPASEAVALLACVVGEDRLTVEPPAVLREVVELCGRLPLAIRIAGARLVSRSGWTAAVLAERLRRLRGRLAELESASRSVAAALELSYRQLRPDQQRAYRLCGLHLGADFDVYAVAALIDTGLPQANRLVEALLDAHLLQEPVPERFGFHDLVRAHASEVSRREETEADERAALSRLLAFFAHTASVASAAAYPSERDRLPRVPAAGTPAPDLPDADSAIAWLDEESPNLLGAAREAAGRSLREPVAALSATLHRHLWTRGQYSEAESLHVHALHLARDAGDSAGERDATIALGGVRRMQARHAEAVELYERALELARSTADRLAEVTVLTALGSLHRLRGRAERAAECFRRARALAEAGGNRAAVATASAGLGHVYWVQGVHEEAERCFEEALALARAAGDRTGELDALTGLGWVQRSQGRYGQVVATFEHAVDIAREIGSADCELAALTGLGWGFLLQGRQGVASSVHQKVLDTAVARGNRNMQFEALQGLGRVNLATGRPGDALGSHEQALVLAVELGQPADEARAHDGIARAQQALGRSVTAREHWSRALKILTGLGVSYTEEEGVTAVAIRARVGDGG